jgi:hypothetical protein
MTDMLQQNRMLLQHNKALGDEVLDLREENSRLHVELIGKCETPVKTVAKVPP